jgi:hypothetical protein
VKKFDGALVRRLLKCCAVLCWETGDAEAKEEWCVPGIMEMGLNVRGGVVVVGLDFVGSSQLEVHYDGDEVGVAVGDEVGAGVGDEVGAGVGDEVDVGVGDKVGSGVGDEVGAGVADVGQ